MGRVEKVIDTQHEHGVECTNGHSYFWKLTDAARALIGTPCKDPGCTATIVEYERDMEYVHEEYVCACGSHDAEKRYVWGIYYNIMCDKCWNQSGMEVQNQRGFDPTYAGERMEEDY